MRLLLLSSCLLLAACGNAERGSTADARGATHAEEEQYDIRQEIADLKYAKDPDAISDYLKYEAARDKLFARKQAALGPCTEALRSHSDWGVRLGCIEVLGTFGGNAEVGHLIAVLDDPAPLVMSRANTALEAMVDHRVIPKAGAPAEAGVPPFPALDPTKSQQVAMEARLRDWHRDHRGALKAAWEAWWKENRGMVKVGFDAAP